MEDLVKVVRCKDCMDFDRNDESGGYCHYWDDPLTLTPNYVHNDDYCSRGKLRENEK
jgi:hypothetical protein